MTDRLKVNVLLFCILQIAPYSIAGCGYTTGSLLPERIKTIAIPVFKNSITQSSLAYEYHPGLEADVTRETIDRFLFDGTLKVIDDENADLVLRGELIDYIKDPLTYAHDSKTVTEYRLSLVVNATCYDTSEGVFMWKQKIIGKWNYFPDVDEAAALALALDDLAKNIVDRTIKDW